MSSSHVLVAMKENRAHGPYIAAFLWSASRVATQPFPARLESFAITWLPVRQLNLPVWGGAAVAHLTCQRQWWQPGCPSHTSLLHCSDPPGVLHQPGLPPSATAKPDSSNPCNCASCSKPLSLKKHKQPIPRVKQFRASGVELAISSTRSCCILATYLFSLIQHDFSLIALFPYFRANISLCSHTFSSQCPTDRGWNRMSPTCTFHEGSPVLQQGCSNHTYPTVPRNRELAQAIRRWLSLNGEAAVGCCELSWMCHFTDILFLVFILWSMVI